MLQRASDKFVAHGASRNDLAKQLFPSSSPPQDGNIHDQFKKARSVQAGSVAATARPGTQPLRSRSPNAMTAHPRGATHSTQASSGLGSFLVKHDSFKHEPTTRHAGPDRAGVHGSPITHRPAYTQSHVEFDENDFDDDAGIELDLAIPLASSPSTRPREASASATHRYGATTSRPNTVASKSSASSSGVVSSAPTCSLPEPSAITRRARPQVCLPGSTNHDNLDDPNPRPSKRRELPWVKVHPAQDQEVICLDDDSSDTAVVDAICFRCKQHGHYTKDCKETRGSAWEHTPNTREKSTPWNTTASALKAQKSRKRSLKSDQAVGAAAAEKVEKVVHLAPINLTAEQRAIKTLVVDQKKSIFYTGSAGTGKSVLMRAIIADLREKFRKARAPDRLAITASTGLAACNIGGSTLHSFAGIGLGKDDVPTLVRKIRKQAKAKQRWITTQVLVIDEISMVDGDLFDKLEAVARGVRNNGRPFGGIQLVVTGDFFQLPPVVSGQPKFAFDAATWATCIDHTIGLKEVFRQKDPVFANMLNELRLGVVSKESLMTFKNLSREVTYEDTLEATDLFPTRNEVDNANSNRMRSLLGNCYTFDAVDSGTTDEQTRERQLANIMAPKKLELKKGAQVMLIKNLDDGLVNGSVGKVVAFMDENTFASYDQDPDTLNAAVDGHDQTTLASEARRKIEASKTAGKTLYPYVQFMGPDGETRSLLVKREEFKLELPNGDVIAQRSQLPLILAWALSIHKAQGQTLERVRVDLRRIFEKGQAYVALSRATSKAGLVVRNFDAGKVMVHARVVEFYKNLASAESATATLRASR